MTGIFIQTTGFNVEYGSYNDIKSSLPGASPAKAPAKAPAKSPAKDKHK
jgi:hypothetical protein